MNDYGISPFTMLQVLSPLLIIGPILLWLLMLGPFVLYLIARWRAHRDLVVDPQLGLKTAFEYFGLIGFQFALFGATVVVWAILTKMSDERGDMVRFAFGFFIPAVIVYFAHHALLKRTNQLQFTGVRRLFQGYNLIITGLVGVTGFFMVFHALFMKGNSGELGRISAALLVVYGGAWAACGIQFGRMSLDSLPEPPRAAGAPPGPSVPQQPPSGPSLPSLGGGSFPPIDPK